MIDSPFYHASVRRIVAAFGSLFDDITIERKDSLGAVVQQLKVPITYAPKQRFYQMLEYSTTDDSTNLNVIFPRMSYEMTSLEYDSSRKLNTLNKVVDPAGTGPGKMFAYGPVPYNISFSLYIGTKNTDDALQIVEQIVPYFTPHFTVSIFELDGPKVSRDVPYTLRSVDFSDSYDGDVRVDRTIVWTMNFVASGYIYGPTKEDLVIKRARVEMFINGEQTQTETTYVNPPFAAPQDPYTVITEVVTTTEETAPDAPAVIDGMIPLV